MAADLIADRVRPVTLAGERVLPVPGVLGELLPGGAVQRGSVVSVDGALGAGVTSVVLQLTAAATAAGEWAGFVEAGTPIGGWGIGGLAADQAGVALERFAVVRRVPPERWAAVVAALLEGFALVAIEVPRFARSRDARRLAARARERGTILVGARGWPVEAALRLDAEGWSGSSAGGGELRVRVAGRGVAGASPAVLAVAG